MLAPSSGTKIYLFTGHTDMRKGACSLALLASSLLSDTSQSFGKMFIFRGKSTDKIKILWWDGQGFCLFYKCFDQGKFIWPSSLDKSHIGITGAQLAMLLEGVDWRSPKWFKPPEYIG